MFSNSKTFSIQLLSKLNKIYLFIISLIVIGSSISIYGLYQLFTVSEQELDPSTYTLTQVCEKDPDFGAITVDIGGGVKKPGVYMLSPGKRVSDLVDLAGGFSRNADKEFTNKVLNLAEKLTDSEKLYIPTIADSIESVKKIENKSKIGNTIAINSASKSELESLSGIGEKRAEEIITARPYQSVNDLLERKVLTQKLFDDLKSQLTI